MTNRKSLHFKDVTNETLLLVEGIDDALFFKAFLGHLGRTNIQVAYVGSWDRFRPVLVMLRKAPNFALLRRLGIVRDADRSAPSTLESLSHALTDAQLPSPVRPWKVFDDGSLAVSLAILPDGSSPGNLENLCLRSIGMRPESACIDQYIECRENAGAQIADNRMAKSKVYTYLAVGKDGKKPGLRIGEAAEAGVWNWDDSEFRHLSDFLRKL